MLEWINSTLIIVNILIRLGILEFCHQPTTL